MPKKFLRGRKSDPWPRPLPPRLLPETIRRRPMLLGLDYDGTISEITDDPASAFPLAGIRELLAALARWPRRIALAIVSGRELDELIRLLGVDRGLFLVGVHGLELMEPGGRRQLLSDFCQFAFDLEKVRVWLGRNAPESAGFLIEDKGGAIALHYRRADPEKARAVCAKFRAFIAAETPSLRDAAGKMVIEAIPRGTSKAHAVRLLRQRVGESFLPAYFGDDMTDEDVFRDLDGQGITVLVGERRPSSAHYRVDGPAHVARVIADLASALEAGDEAS